MAKTNAIPDGATVGDLSRLLNRPELAGVAPIVGAIFTDCRPTYIKGPDRQRIYQDRLKEADDLAAVVSIPPYNIPVNCKKTSKGPQLFVEAASVPEVQVTLDNQEPVTNSKGRGGMTVYGEPILGVNRPEMQKAIDKAEELFQGEVNRSGLSDVVNRVTGSNTGLPVVVTRVKSRDIPNFNR